MTDRTTFGEQSAESWTGLSTAQLAGTEPFSVTDFSAEPLNPDSKSFGDRASAAYAGADKDLPVRDTRPMTEMNREELDAKLSAVEARMDRRISDFQGDMRQAVADFRLEIQPLKNIKANIWSATAVMVGTIIAVVGLSFTAFDSGRETAVLVQEAKQQTIDTRQLLEQIKSQQSSQAAVPATPR